MISILLPVRRDSHLLQDCIKSIFEMTDDVSNIEIVVSISKNEKRNISFLESYEPLIKVVYDDKALGRVGLHEYMNSCVKASSGQLLWHFCDDYRIRTEGYDQILKSYEYLGNKVFRLIPNPASGRHISGFASPIITRKWIDITGHWALAYSVDSWIGEIAGYLPQDRKEINLPIDMEDITYTEKDMGIATPRPDEDEDPIKSGELLIRRPWACQEIRDEIKHDADLLIESIKNE